MSDAISKSRTDFEKWISSAPYEMSTDKYPDDPALYAWPKVYKDPSVQIAFDAYLEALQHAGQGEAVAEVVSGYSGDPDTRGNLAIKRLDLSRCKIGDKLYTQPQSPAVPDGFVIVERSALSEVLRISDREHPAWESCRTAMLTASGKGE